MGSILSRAELARNLSGPSTGGVPALHAVIDPEGKRISLEAEGAVVPVSKSGFYKGENQPGEAFPLFAANLASPSESKIKPSTTLPLRSKQPIAEIKEGFRLGFEPWVALVFLALVLSLLSGDFSTAG
jgi:hypothetical protein